MSAKKKSGAKQPGKKSGSGKPGNNSGNKGGAKQPGEIVSTDGLTVPCAKDESKKE